MVPVAATSEVTATTDATMARCLRLRARPDGSERLIATRQIRHDRRREANRFLSSDFAVSHADALIVSPGQRYNDVVTVLEFSPLSELG
ncbi:hypothetical protein C8039_13285 [Halogeometricum sp. wsp3]|nr:hypothetical protein C8039_13285 [Halogeometricum sp. wsp3]